MVTIKFCNQPAIFHFIILFLLPCFVKYLTWAPTSYICHMGLLLESIIILFFFAHLHVKMVFVYVVSNKQLFDKQQLLHFIMKKEKKNITYIQINCKHKRYWQANKGNGATWKEKLKRHLKKRKKTICKEWGVQVY